MLVVPTVGTTIDVTCIQKSLHGRGLEFLLYRFTVLQLVDSDNEFSIGRGGCVWGWLLLTSR